MLQHRAARIIDHSSDRQDRANRWFNGVTSIGTPAGGFSAKDRPQWYERLYLSLFLPLRRELAKDWFRIVLRFGNIGGEEDLLRARSLRRPSSIQHQAYDRAQGEEELFVFVNDAVIGIPGLYDLLYRNNRGSARITVRRTR